MSHEQREQALLAAYDEHANAVFRFCYALCGDREQAHDATQEAYVRTWQYLRRGKSISLLKPFLYQTARNILIDVSRRASTQSLDQLRENGFDQEDMHVVSPQASAQVDQIARAIASLDVSYRDVVALRYVHDMMPREIATLLGESENVVSVRIHRGVAKLRERLGI